MPGATCTRAVSALVAAHWQCQPPHLTGQHDPFPALSDCSLTGVTFPKFDKKTGTLANPWPHGHCPIKRDPACRARAQAWVSTATCMSCCRLSGSSSSSWGQTRLAQPSIATWHWGGRSGALLLRTSFLPAGLVTALKHSQQHYSPVSCSRSICPPRHAAAHTLRQPQPPSSSRRCHRQFECGRQAAAAHTQGVDTTMQGAPA
jgi:hypothetical protein